MTKTAKMIYGGVLAAVAVLLVFGTLYDTAIAQTVYQPDNFMAKIFESAGIFPPFIFVSSMFVVLFFMAGYSEKKQTVKRVVTAGLSAIPYLVYGFMASETYLSALWARAIVAVGAAAVLTPLTFLVFRKKSQDTLKKLTVFLIFASIVSVLSSLISINVLKYVWGRPRYREMMAEGDFFLDAFTPWYHINGLSLHGHHSFPSGHTCSATNLLVLCALDEVFPMETNKKKTITFLVCMYIFTMAYSRLVLGAHFLSDVTGGFFIGFLVYAVAKYVYFNKSRAVVTAIMGDGAVESVAEEGAVEEAPIVEETPSSEGDPEVLKTPAAEPSEDLSEEKTGE